MTYDDQTRILRQASVLLRRIDVLADGKPIDGVRAVELADGLIEISDYLTRAELERGAEIADRLFSVRVPGELPAQVDQIRAHGALRLIEGGR